MAAALDMDVVMAAVVALDMDVVMAAGLRQVDVGMAAGLRQVRRDPQGLGP
jgi:hypothetical protein